MADAKEINEDICSHFDLISGLEISNTPSFDLDKSTSLQFCHASIGANSCNLEFNWLYSNLFFGTDSNMSWEHQRLKFRMAEELRTMGVDVVILVDFIPLRLRDSWVIDADVTRSCQIDILGILKCPDYYSNKT